MAEPDEGQGRDYRQLMTEALIELDSLQSQLDDERRARSEPIAVVGMGCRLPGSANGPESFWTMLRDGVDAVGEIPRQRWDLDRYYDPDMDAPGKIYCRHAALVDQNVVERFSPEFFGIAPREAERMDPQQRVLLEVCWEALENAAIAHDGVQGSRTGLFVGSCTDDYLQLFNNLADAERIDGYSSLGTARCITVGRVAYLLGFVGPVVQLDTACSSSLVAVHQGCLSLRNRDSDMVLAGGVNLQLSPVWTLGLCKLKALSPDGRCKTFDAQANGFVRGEGCGIVVLKRLSDALDQGDRILALIRGTAVNHDGRSSGLTVPNPSAQEQLLQQALQSAGLQPDEVDYIEAHGTGTSLGDPIEMGALGAVYGDRDGYQPLWVGSVKTNIGHLEGAAGIAGLMKTILALDHEELPPHLHFHEPNPHIPWQELPVRIPVQRTPWARGTRRRVAGVSSFGFSGTNAHVIVEEAPLREEPAIAEPSWHLLPVSARSPEALRDLISRYRAVLGTERGLRLGDICFTAAVGRSHFAHRVAVLGENATQVRQRLDALARGEQVDGVWSAEVQGMRAEPAGEREDQPVDPQDRQADPRGWKAFLADVAEEYVAGESIDWQSIYRGRDNRKVSLPTYPFQRRRYWLGSSDVPPVRPAKVATTAVHPLLGEPVFSAATADLFQFEAELSAGRPAYLADHRAGDTTVLPATAQLEMALAAGRRALATGGLGPVQGDDGRPAVEASGSVGRPATTQVGGPATARVGRPATTRVGRPATTRVGGPATDWPLAVENVTFHRALTLPGDVARIVQTVLTPDAKGYRFELFSRPPSQQVEEPTPTWTRHASATVVPVSGDRSQAAVSVDDLLQQCHDTVSPEDVYARIANQGLQYGPSFRLLRRVWRGNGQALGEAELPEGWTDGAPDYGVHPALMDACLHTVASMVETDSPAMVVPTRVERLEVFRPAGTRLWSHVRLREAGDLAKATGFTVDADLLDPNGAVVARIEGLRLQQVDRSAMFGTTKDDVADWIYQVNWQETPVDRGAATRGPGAWLLLADNAGVAELLAQRLCEQGHRCLLVHQGNAYHATESQREQIRRFRVRPDVAEDFARLLQDSAAGVSSDGGGPLAIHGVIHLWSLDVPRDEGEAFAVSHRLSCGSALHLVQALLNRQIMIGVWLVTRGAESLPGDRANAAGLAQAPLAGFRRVVNVEHPDLRCMQVDLDPEADSPSQAKALFEELIGSPVAELVAYRRTSRHVARLVPSRVAEDRFVPADDGSYLITGGLGKLGLQLARWLAGRGARHVVLTSRHGPSTSEQSEAIDRMLDGGIDVRVVPADMGSRDDVRRLLATIKSELPPLRGVLHVAGVLDDAAVLRQDWPRFERVMRPKVAGAWHLHCLTEDLDFFAMFSSAAGLVGSPGQANYAAANAFLDALARYRRSLGQPALSIAWGPWDIGMSARLDEAARTRLSRIGLRSIRVPDGLQMLGHLLSEPPAHVAALKVDWSRLAIGLTASPLWADLAGRSIPAGRRTDAWGRQLREAPAGNRMRILIERIRGEVAGVLGWDSPKRVGIQQKLFDLGMDSLTSVELQQRLERNLEVPLPLTLAFDYPSVEALAQYVLSKLGLESLESSAGSAASEVAPVEVDRLAEMSEEEVRSLLQKKYKDLL